MTQERETTERQREELEQEKARMSSVALRLKTRTQEVEAFSEVRKRRFHSSPQRRRRVDVSDILGNFPFSPSLQLAAEKHEAGVRALQEAKLLEAEHKARLANIHGQTERLRLQEQRILQVGARPRFKSLGLTSDLFFLLYEVREDPQQEAFLSVNTQERMRFSHVQKETERSRPAPPVTSSPVAPGDVMFGFSNPFFLLILLM